MSMKEIINRHIAAKTRAKFPIELRKFALSIHFYSRKAYEYLRSEWRCLPSESTIKSWYRVVDGTPGFTDEAFSALKLMVETKATLKKGRTTKKHGREVVCNLVLDEISIKESVQFLNNEPQGFVNMGAGLCADADNQELANHMLTFMVVGLNGAWKLPIGYFAIRTLTGKERANILKTCLEMLHETGVKLCSLTFDGQSSTITMVKELGANFNYGTSKFQPWFEHPITKEPVYVL